MARVARFYGWPPAVVLGLSLGQLARWDALRDEVAAEEELVALTVASVPHMTAKARKAHVERVARRANPAGPAPPDPARQRQAKARLAMLMAGKGLPDA